MRPTSPRAFFSLLILILVYFVAGKLGLALAFIHPSATAVWPAAGIALATLLLKGRAMWPGIFVGAFLVNLTTAGTVLTSIFIATGNTLEAVIACTLVNTYVGGTRAFDTSGGVLRYIAFAVLGSTMVSATIGGISLAWGGFASWNSLGAIWVTWWLGDVASNMTIAPLIVLARDIRIRDLNMRTVAGAALITLLIFLVTQIQFGVWLEPPGRHWPLIFLGLPLLVWLGFQYDRLGSLIGTLLMSCFAIFWTLRGFGTFATEQPVISLFLLQVYMTTISGVTLVVGAALLERKTFESLLRSRERDLTIAQEIAHLGNWEWDVPSNRVSWSDELFKLFGLAPGSIALSYETFLDRVHQDDRARVRSTIEDALRSRAAFQFDHRVVLPDGTVRFLHGRGEIVLDSSGVVSKIQGTAQDITTRKHAEEALSVSERRFRDLAESMPQIVWTSDAAGHLTYLNQQWAAYTGLPAEMSLRAETSRRALHPDDVAKTREIFRQAIERSAPFLLEYRLRRHDGVYRWHLARGKPLREGDGDIVQWLGTSTDIHDLKSAQEEIISMNELLEKRVQQRTSELLAANKELEGFSYSVSHDLRAPIRAVSFYARFLNERVRSGIGDQERHYLDMIIKSSEEMDKLVDGLLNFSRLGRKELETQRVDMNELVQMTCEEQRKFETGRDIQIDLKNLPPLECDVILMRQVLVNLVSNAIKFTKFKKLARIEVGSFEKNGETVYYIEDNGAGFDMQYADKLFGVFQRLHRQDEFEGMGIGLAFAQRIILRHGGRMWGEGRVGEGATFYFAFGRNGES